MKQLILASGNSGKLKEFQSVFAGLGVEVLPITALVAGWSVEETGATFFENARLKAEAAVRITGLPALADDSGLTVYYLGGAPGVLSQRFAGPQATDALNNELLLERLIPAKDRRQAHFTAVLALAQPDRPTRFAVARLFGRIAHERRGEGGFGYDPIFEVRGLGKTLAEIPLEHKNKISHRALALRVLLAQCSDFHA